MKKIQEYYNEIKNKEFDTYRLDEQLIADDIVNIVDFLSVNKFDIESRSVQNIGEEEDFFSEFYEKLDYFYERFPYIDRENIYKVTIVNRYNDRTLSLVFDDGLNKLIVAYPPDMNVDSLLVAIENVCQKKINS